MHNTYSGRLWVTSAPRNNHPPPSPPLILLPRNLLVTSGHIIELLLNTLERVFNELVVPHD